MNRVLGWMRVVVLCWAAGGAAGEASLDARLLEAQQAFDEATRLQEAGNVPGAIERGERARALRQAVLGGTHPEVAASLSQLGNLYREQELYTRAELLLTRALAIREAALGKHHLLVAASLSDLAQLYGTQGLSSQAEPHAARALAIREAALGKHHLLVAASLNSLAQLHWSQGAYSRATALQERALAIQEAALGPHHPDVARTLHHLATLASDQGLYARAEPLYTRALTLREAALGPSHPDVARTLHQLALLYLEQGLYERAEPLFLRTLALEEKTSGLPPPHVAQVLYDLGQLYRRQGRYAQAEPFFQRALLLLEATLDRSHGNVARTLHHLALLYLEQGLYAQAEPLFERALAIWEETLGQNHPLVGESLHHLALLHLEQGAYMRAEPLFLRALAIREKALGYEHPDVALTLNGLAGLRLVQHRLGEALPLLTRAFNISEQRLRQEALGFSESRLTTFLQFLRADEERLHALLRAHPGEARLRRLALSAVLLRKGRSAEESASTSRTIYRGLSSRDRATFERLRTLRTQLARLSLDGPGALPPEAYLQRLKELSAQGDALEADLAQRSAPLRALTALPSPAEIVDRVAAALPRNGALVEFVVYQDPPLVPRPRAPAPQRSGPPRYLALVLLPDARIHALDLGPAEPIDQAASHLRDALARKDADYLQRAQALYALAFQPLLPLLGSSRRLYLAPDGQLNLASFAALHDGQGFLIDTFDISYLTSGKDLLPRPTALPSPGSAVVFAAPLIIDASQAQGAEHPWPPLPGTRQEAQAIQHQLPHAQLFLGREATKERLLQLPTPGILHFATHGFFHEDAATLADSRAVGYFGAVSGGTPAQRPSDPLLRSGLVLTGTHAPDLEGAPADSALVTALELAGLDLWGTELVVLSACDTGRGDVRLGQGVYGLRRAFIVAGAETVVMSLWKVNDGTTSQLMGDYYRQLLAGKGRAGALRDAMRALRKTHPHPHFWAPFIALGRDAPLRSLAPTSPRSPSAQ